MSKIRVTALVWLGVLTTRVAPAQQAPDSAFTVNGRVALHSLMSLSDAHLTHLRDLLQLVAATDAARSGDWQRIRAPLAELAALSVPAVLWYARPDGTVWNVQQVRGNLAQRAYFPRVLRGESVCGDLVVSTTTKRNTAIVAVPIRGRGNAVTGVLGASVHLDSLGEILKREMGGFHEPLIFFAIDSTPIGALNSDPSLIFTDPMQLGDEGMKAAFTEMLTGSEGTVSYIFRDHRRTVIYVKSSVTGWWYGLGQVGEAVETGSDK